MSGNLMDLKVQPDTKFWEQKLPPIYEVDGCGIDSESTGKQN